jgi:hypothetical protein
MNAVSFRNFRRSAEIFARKSFINIQTDLLAEISLVENQNTNLMMISLRPMLGMLRYPLTGRPENKKEPPDLGTEDLEGMFTRYKIPVFSTENLG